jgi:hypothetical protein
MKTKMILKLTVVGAVIVAAGCLLRGHDILTGLALSLLFLVVAAKMAFSLVARHHGGWPPASGGADSAGRPELRPPGVRPPVLSAAEAVRHEPTA